MEPRPHRVTAGHRIPRRNRQPSPCASACKYNPRSAARAAVLPSLCPADDIGGTDPCGSSFAHIRNNRFNYLKDDISRISVRGNTNENASTNSADNSWGIMTKIHIRRGFSSVSCTVAASYSIYYIRVRMTRFFAPYWFARVVYNIYTHSYILRIIKPTPCF